MSLSLDVLWILSEMTPFPACLSFYSACKTFSDWGRDQSQWRRRLERDMPTEYDGRFPVFVSYGNWRQFYTGLYRLYTMKRFVDKALCVSDGLVPETFQEHYTLGRRYIESAYSNVSFRDYPGSVPSQRVAGIQFGIARACFQLFAHANWLPWGDHALPLDDFAVRYRDFVVFTRVTPSADAIFTDNDYERFCRECSDEALQAYFKLLQWRWRHPSILTIFDGLLEGFPELRFIKVHKRMNVRLTKKEVHRVKRWFKQNQ